MHVLLATNHFFADTGSEVAISSLARCLVERGIRVSLYCPHMVKSFVIENLPDSVVSSPSLQIFAGTAFDIAHVQHGPLAIRVRAAFPTLPMVFSSQGVLPFLEQPPPLELGIGRFLAITEEVAENLLSKGVDASLVEQIPNYIQAERFFFQRPGAYPPRNILAISNRLDMGRMQKLEAAANTIGARIRFIGGGNPVANKDIPALIREHDLVVSLGRGVIEALMSGRPVVVYDYLGGDGAVSLENYAQLKKKNFSGRTGRKEFTAEELAGEFLKVRPEDTLQLAKIVRADFSFEDNLQGLLEIYSRLIASGCRMAEGPLNQARYLTSAIDESIGWDRQMQGRQSDELSSEFKDLVARRCAPSDQSVPVGVAIHAFYVDGLEEILLHLASLETPLHLYVTCVAGQEDAVLARLQASTLAYSLFRVDNRGRDVLPFLRVLPYLRRDGIRVLLKLHTKKSLHLEESGSERASDLYDSLLDPVFFQATLKRFAEDANLQVLGPERYRLPIAQYLHGNDRKNLQMLAKRAGLDEQQVMSGEFFAGTMFFARLQGLQALQKLGLRNEDFEPEQGQVEGTLAHAMERFFLVLAQGQRPPDRATLYRQWLTTRILDQAERNGLPARLAAWPEQPSVLVVLDDAYPGEGLVARSLASLKEQVYAPGAVLVLSDREPAGIDPADNLLWLPRGENWQVQLNEVLPQVGVDWFYLLRGGDVLDPHALLLLAERIAERPQMLCCYSDEDRWLPGSGEDPVFKPDFNLDMLRSYPYVGRALAFQRQAFLEAGGFEAGFSELAPHDLLLRLVEIHGLPSVGHLAEVLVHQHEHLGQWLVEAGVAPRVAPLVSAHLQRLGVPHAIQPGALRMINRVVYRFPGEPLVSIVIPTKDQLPMLRRCVESLLERTRYQNYEVLIIDNASEAPDAVEWLADVERMVDDKVRVLRYPHPFNFSAINNFAVEQARGEYLVLLNNDTAVVDGDWLEALLNHARRPEVGIVGARLHYPDGRIQHGGVVLGLRGVADHPFIGEAKDAKGYMQRLQIDQNYSAVTAACLMIRKPVYEEIGGMDEEAFKVSFNDVDLCLKVGEAGYLTVWTPYAALIHEANVSQNQVDRTAQAAKVERFRGEQAAMYRKWLPKLAHDPAYNQNLNLDGTGFALDHRAEAGWQPFARRQLPHVLCHAADPYGCGHYRVMQPFTALREAGLLGGALSERLFSVVEMERIAPDSVVFQRQLFPQQLEVLRETRAYSKAFKIYELDDYIVGLPDKSQHRKQMPKDVAEWLRQGVGLCDRFVVSTAPLAEAFGDLHTDIRVVENRLPTGWWGEVGALAQRRVGRKPRVGWAGGSSHSGDLELIVEVVRELANEVEWVFFGMCPEAIRPYVHEVHAGVPIDQYPAKLASLNLDLALAPLEENLFNECKSNLRLLEYGICGFPVVCTDLVCYRGDLPVTRVKNGNKGWIDAIRMHLTDLDATAAMGDALQARVRCDWMLEGRHLENWRNAWLAD